MHYIQYTVLNVLMIIIFSMELKALNSREYHKIVNS